MRLVRGGQHAHEAGHLAANLLGDPGGELLALGRGGDADGPAVVRVAGAHDQAAPPGPVDQTGHAGLVQAEIPGQLLHAGLPVTQHAEQPERRDRHVIPGGGPAQDLLDQERQLNQAVGDPEIHGTGRCLVPAAAAVCHAPSLV